MLFFEFLEVLLRGDDFALEIVPFRRALCDAALRFFELREPRLCAVDSLFKILLLLY
jgi:hypothetical protein